LFDLNLNVEWQIMLCP